MPIKQSYKKKCLWIIPWLLVATMIGILALAYTPAEASSERVHQETDKRRHWIPV